MYNSAMPLTLTEPQWREVEAADAPAEVTHPQTKRRYVLMAADEVAELRDQAADAEDQRQLREASARTLGRRLAEGE